MPTTVSIPGYDKPIDFPDSMSREEIGKASKRLFETKLTENTRREGVYKMQGPGGDFINVPYSKVGFAFQFKHKMTPQDVQRYARDSASDPNRAVGLRERIDIALAPGEERTLKEKGIAALKGTAAGLVQPFVHPVETAVSQGEAVLASGVAPGGMYPATTSIRPEDIEANRQAQIAAQQEFAEQGAEARRHPVYTVAGVVGPPLVTAGITKVAPRIPVVRGAVEGLRGLREGAKERIRTGAQTLIGAGERPVREAVEAKIGQAGKEREKALQTARKEAAAYQKKVEEAKAETAKTMEAHRDAARVDSSIAETSKEVDERVAKAKTKAKEDNDAEWEGVRANTAEIEGPIGPLKQVVETAKEQADPTSSPLFRSILKTGEGAFDEAGRPVVNGQARSVVVDGRPVPISDKNYPLYYEMQYGEPPPVNGPGGTTNFSRLQRWYTYLNDRMYSGGRLEAGTYRALKMTKDAIADAMRSITDKAGEVPDPKNPGKKISVTSMWDRARKSHQNMMEAFYDSPAEKRTAESQFKRETTPELQKEQGIKNRR